MPKGTRYTYHSMTQTSVAAASEMITMIQGWDWYQVRGVTGVGAEQLMLSTPPIELLTRV